MRKQGGLTSAELLAAISVIAILIAVLVPGLQRVREKARDVVCQSRLKQWGLLLKMYTDDHEGRFFEGQLNTGSMVIHDRGRWMACMQPYREDEMRVLACPSAGHTVENPTFNGSSPPQNLPGACENGPEDAPGPATCTVESYGINGWVYRVREDAGYGRWYWKSLEGLAGRDRIPVLLDSRFPEAWPLDYDEPPQYPGDFNASSRESCHADRGPGMKSFCVNRHGGFINALFMNGSVRNVGLRELWALKWHRNYETAGPWTTAGGATGEDWPEWLRGFKDY